LLTSPPSIPRILSSMTSARTFMTPSACVRVRPWSCRRLTNRWVSKWLAEARAVYENAR
jgi:hypothetical protein